MKKIKFDFKLKIFLLLFIIIISILIGLIINSFKEEELLINEYTSEDINFYYDNSFEIINDEDYIELSSKDKDATILIKKIDYTTNSRDKNRNEISSSLAYQVIENKNNYIETYQEKDKNIDRYYYLYENYEEERQIEVINTFSEQYIYVIIYSAKNAEFDLYSESVSFILDSIEV